MSKQGTVKFFNSEKGFGFIEAEGGDIFVHVNDCGQNPPQEGDSVSFEEEYDERKGKTKAVNVQGGTGVPGGNNKGYGGGYGKGGGKGYERSW